LSTFENLSFSVEEFSGTVRLFPLPNLVLFPYVMQPLHVFEPRYRELLEDALDGDRLITMAVLRPGWERDYEGRPPLYPVGCLGRVATYHRLDDGTYNLLLLGMHRVRLLQELEPSRSFRQATASICQDHFPVEKVGRRGRLHRELRETFLQIVPMLPDAHEQLDQLLGSDISLGVLTDVIAYMLDIDLGDKQVLLAESDVHRRAEILLGHLAAVAAEPTTQGAGPLVFPPPFSAN